MTSTLKTMFAILVMSAGLSACSTFTLDMKPMETGFVDSDSNDPDKVFDAGKRQLTADNLGLAVNLFRQANFLRPNDIRILNALAVVYDRMGRTDLSEHYFLRALALNGSSPQTLNNIGYSAFRNRDYVRAATILRMAYTNSRNAEQQTVIASNLRALKVVAKSTATPRPVAKAATPPKTPPSHGVVHLVDLQDRPARIQRVAARAYHVMTSRPDAASSSVPFDRRRSTPEALPPIRAVPVEAVKAGELAPPSRSAPAPAPVAALAVPPQQPPSRPPKNPAGPVSAIAVEVCNGAGRRNLAARLGRHLSQGRVSVILKTNDVTFDHRKTVIFYRSGQDADARHVAGMLPFETEMRRVEHLVADVKVRLGGDSLSFDETLIRKFATSQDREERSKR